MSSIFILGLKVLLSGHWLLNLKKTVDINVHASIRDRCKNGRLLTHAATTDLLLTSCTQSNE